MTADSVITLRELRKRHGSGPEAREVLRGASLEVVRGSLVAIVGPSGAGKSSLLSIAGGLDRRYEGGVRVLGHDIATLNDDALSRFRQQSVGFVFQSFHLVPHLDAQRNVALPGLFAGVAGDDSRDRSMRWLEAVGLGDKAHRLPRELSGGERQRVALARALFMDPPLLLADEPTGNLDADSGEQVLRLLDGLRRERSLTVVVVTHEPRVAQRADRVLRLIDGQLAEEAR